MIPYFISGWPGSYCGKDFILLLYFPRTMASHSTSHTVCLVLLNILYRLWFWSACVVYQVEMMKMLVRLPACRYICLPQISLFGFRILSTSNSTLKIPVKMTEVYKNAWTSSVTSSIQLLYFSVFTRQHAVIKCGLFSVAPSTLIEIIVVLEDK